MRYDPLLHRKDRAARRGIAVMFALGILSLVIVAVLVFSRRAVVDRKVASAYSNYNGAKDLAMSAFGRAILQLKKNASSGVAFYSGCAGDDDFDWLWKLDPQKRLLPTDKTAPVRWQYVYDSEGHITGRYAYIVLGENRLKLDAMLDHRFCLAGEECNGVEVGETLSGITGNCPRRRRWGNSGSELRFNYQESLISSYFNFLKKDGSTGGFSIDNLQSVLDDDKKVVQYPSPEHLLYRSLKRKAGGSVSNYRVLNNLNLLFNVSQSSALDEPDAWFGGDANNNGVKDKSEFYQRFLLFKTADQWNSMTVDKILKPANAFYDASGKPVTTNTSGIPWLNNWTDTSGNWPSATNKKKQIAANLINYCASTSTAVVSNIKPETWYDGAKFTKPDYTGNKRTFYLNECKVRVEVELKLGDKVTHNKDSDGIACTPWYSFGDGAGATGKNKLLVRLYLHPEIINLYGEDVIGCNSKKYDLNRVRAFAKIQFDHTKGMSYTMKNKNTDFTNSEGAYTTTPYKKEYKCLGSSLGDATITDTMISDAATKATYQTYAFVLKSDKTKHYLETEVDIDGKFASKKADPFSDDAAEVDKLFKIKNLSVSDIGLFLKTNGEDVDCAFPPDLQAKDGAVWREGSLSTAFEFEKCLSVDDPRNNLHAGDWTEQTETLGAVNAGITFKNAVFDKENGWSQDPEGTYKLGGTLEATLTDPAAGVANTDPSTKDAFTTLRISSAYIRHAPIQSLWELGLIHRAAPWQTLNFKRPKRSSITDANRLKENLTTKGGGPYNEGDFRILDQVTMQGGKSYTPVAQFGKINLRSQNTRMRTFAFSALTQGLYWCPVPYFKNYRYGLQLKAPHGFLDGEKLGDASDELVLFNRSDVYLAPKDSRFWDLIEKAPCYIPDEKRALTEDDVEPKNTHQELTTDAMQEQLIGRFIGLTAAHTMPDSAQVIVLAQTIQDVGGGIPVYRDWDGNGTFSAATTARTGTTTRRNAGYYYRASTSGADKNPADPKFFDVTKIGPDKDGNLYETFTAQFGRYDNGADRITGEAKLVARIQYDRENRKWKIVQVKYEDY